MLPASCFGSAENAEGADKTSAAIHPVASFRRPVIPVNSLADLRTYTLLYRKTGRGSEDLVPIIIHDLHFQRILPRFQGRQREQLFDRHLLGRRSRYLSQLLGIIKNRLVGPVPCDLVLNGTVGLVGLFVRTKIVELGINA